MYRYVKNNDGIQNISIPIESQIDHAVKLKIRERYSPNGEDDGKPNELEMHRKGLINPDDPQYLEYLSYVQECIDWGQSQKEQMITDLEKWANYQWDESKETRDEFVQRIEKAGLI